MIVLRAPAFWYAPHGGWRAAALSPLAWIWRQAALARRRMATPYVARMPVVCLGNVTIGGAGKTPTAIALVEAFGARNPCFLTRGYGGITREATLAAMPDATRHGDEAVLLARHAPVIIAADRVEGLKLAERAGFDLVIADDGFQNPHFAKTAGVLVFDGGVGIGNGRCIPAGPLRELPGDALARAAAVIIVGEDKTGLRAKLGATPVYAAQVVPDALPAEPVVAFAGIGRPAKFFDMLRDGGAKVVEEVSFPDHHPYTPHDMQRLHTLAARHKAMLLTTEKDHVRIPQAMRGGVTPLAVRIVIDDMAALVERLKAA